MNQVVKSLLVVMLLAGLGAFLAYAVFTGALQSQGEVIGDRLGDKNKLLMTEKDFRDKVTELRIQKEKVVRGIKRLELLKSDTLTQLKEKGIRSSKDVTDDPDVRYALRNLKGFKVEIDKLNADIASYDEAIKSIEVMLDELERKRIESEVHLTEEQYFELRKIVVDLNERLGLDEKDVLEDEELSRLLDEELEKDAAEQ